MRRAITIVATALLLSACGGRDKAGNASEAKAGGEAPAGAAAAAVSFRPGEWETTVEVTRLEMTNGPRLPEGMTPPLPPPTTIRSCMTPEQASRPNANFLTGSGERAGCNYENFSMAGGRIQGTVTCTREGTTMRSAMTGQYTPDSVQTTSESEITANGVVMNTAGRTTSRRIGDCPAS